MPAKTTCGAGAADGATLFEAVAVEVAWAMGNGWGCGGTLAALGDSFKASEARDAIGSLGFEGCG